MHAARLAYADYLMQGTAESVRSAAVRPRPGTGFGDGAELLAMRGVIHNAEADQSLTPIERARSLRSAERLARAALAMDPDSASAYVVLGGTACQRQQWDLAHRHATRAADLAPWSPTVLMSAGTVMALAGDWKRGVETLREGFRLNPLHPGHAHSVSALACLIGGDDAGALAEASLVHVPGQLCGPSTEPSPWPPSATGSRRGPRWPTSWRSIRGSSTTPRLLHRSGTLRALRARDAARAPHPVPAGSPG